jgi:hypothetical protein
VTLRRPVYRAGVLRRVLPLTVIGLELLWIGTVMAWHAVNNPAFGLDYTWHVDAARRLLDTGTPYWPWQVSGPYDIGNGAILYPPTAFVLFIPFIWLPAVLWWAIPVAITVWAMTLHRPPLWAWALVGGIVALEKSLNVYVFGNPTMWLVAAVAAATRWGWPSILVLAKPTFAPLALIGVGRRSWWVALAAFAGVSLLFGGLWLEWLRVATNSDVSALYNLPSVPLMLGPLVPWFAGERRPKWVDALRARYAAVAPLRARASRSETAARLSSRD